MNELDNFSFEIETNSLTSKEKAPDKFKENIPEWALFFKAIASNWNLNRNGYIIRAKAWITWADGKKDLTALNDYLKNWKILFQHDSNKPIGKPLDLKVVWNELILTAWVFDNTHSNWDIGRGLVTSISTGHMTQAIEFENIKTWEIQSEDEFIDDKNASPLEKLWSGIWVMAVTSAEMIENSLVTIGSVRGGHIINNKKYLINKLWISEDEFKILLSKKSTMKKKELDEMKAWITIPEVNNTEEKVIEAPEVIDTPVEENKINNKQEIVLTDEIKSFLTNTIADLQKDFDLKINAMKQEKRDDLASVVKNTVKTEETDPKTDLKNALRQD